MKNILLSSDGSGNASMTATGVGVAIITGLVNMAVSFGVLPADQATVLTVNAGAVVAVGAILYGLVRKAINYFTKPTA